MKRKARDQLAGETLDEPQRKRARYDTDLSLDDFQARYTSEDNSSFTKILQDENEERKEKYGWAWAAQKRVEAQRDRMIEQRERMLIEPPPESVTGVRGKFMIEAPQPAGLITNGEESKNEGGPSHNESQALIVVELKDQPPTDVMAPTKDTRKAGVDGWKFKVGIHLTIISYCEFIGMSTGKEWVYVRPRRRCHTTRPAFWFRQRKGEIKAS